MTSLASPVAPADAKSSDFAGVFVLLAPHFAELDRFLDDQIRTFEPEIRPLVRDCIAASGQRMLPALVFLSGWRGADAVAPGLVRGAAVIELVRLATGVHDRLMATPAEPGEGDTPVSGSGPTPAVLLGDALFAHGLYLPTQFATTEICAAVTAATRRMCAGEIVKALHPRSAAFTRAEYLRIAELKTAELFRVSCFLGGSLAGADAGYVAAVSGFGRHFGLAYQIWDDWAGCIRGEPGSDQLTLPRAILLERLPADEREAMRAEIRGQQTPQVALRRRQMREFGVASSVAEAAQAALASASAELRDWPGHPPTALLLKLCDALGAQMDGLWAAGGA